jgi:L-ribulokinase
MPYSIGVDFGTESGRVIVLDLTTGRELGVSVIPYRHGVISELLPETNEKLPPDWALQDPADYIEVLHTGIPAVLHQTGVPSEEIIGLGIDFTSCTVMPVTEDGTPLCMLPQWRSHRHSWPKLWKHHAAQRIADRINKIGIQRNEAFLSRYGGSVSSEWYFPKLIEVFEEDREIYSACHAFVEAADWVVWYLTGRECRNSCTAGYKAMWSPTDGLPSKEFFQAVNPEFKDPSEKLGNHFHSLGTKAGTVRPEIARELGLSSNVSVAVGNVDAMVSMPGAGVNTPGSLVMVMGTSLCHLLVSEQEILLPGITGVVKDGILPGYYGYEAGQAAVGDMYAWFVKNAIPDSYFQQAKEVGKDIYQYLESLAEKLAPGQNGIVALDWWNGNRSILGDTDLTGVILGLNLMSRPEEIYRALLESTAFGTRRIIDNFRDHGVAINELIACGGIPHKSPLLMQIYADVCGLPVIVKNSGEIPARGAAMFGAVAAGAEAGGFDSILEASAKLGPDTLRTYQPNADAHEIYEQIYSIYRGVYDFFGSERPELLHQLKQLRVEAVEDSISHCSN